MNLATIAAIVALTVGPSAFTPATQIGPGMHAGPIRRPGPSPLIGGRDHTLFGVITKLSRTLFTVRLRSGRTLVVDASEAIANGTFSAPLFVGKNVVVKGKADARGIIHADTVTRITHIDATTAQDR